MVPMNIQSGYQVSDSGAAMYEKYAAHYMGQWVPGLVDAAELTPGERVLDLACGTGLIAREAAARVGSGGRVTGLDINAGMLAVARAMSLDLGTTINWIQGSATAIELPDAMFDIILCQQGLQFFPDQTAALREMLRVLVPGGRVALSVWKSPSPYNDAIGDALEHLAGPEPAARYRAGRRDILPSAEALRGMMVAAGFRGVEVRPCTVFVHLPSIEEFVLGHLAGHPVASVLNALGEDGRAAFAQHVKNAMQPYAEGDGVAFPDQNHIATARR